MSHSNTAPAGCRLTDDPEALDELERLGRIFAMTTPEIAMFYGVSVRTVQRRFVRYPAARAALEAGRAVAEPGELRRLIRSRRGSDMVEAGRRLGILPREVRP